MNTNNQDITCPHCNKKFKIDNSKVAQCDWCEKWVRIETGLNETKIITAMFEPEVYNNQN